jgi:hypothetical protein
MPTATLAWNCDILAVPLDYPVLVAQIGEPVPFMAVREKENPDVVNMLLGPDSKGSGHYADLNQLASWLDVGPHPSEVITLF